MVRTMPTAKKALVPSEQVSAPTPHDRLFGPVPGAKNLYDAMKAFVAKARLRREGTGEIQAAIRNMADLAVKEVDSNVEH